MLIRIIKSFLPIVFSGYTFTADVVADELSQSLARPLSAETDEYKPSFDKSLMDALSDSALGLTAVFGTATYLGVDSWNWGTSDFAVEHEGWFEMDTGSGGADKLGHLYTTYAISEGLTYSLLNKSYSPEDAAFYGALFGWASMLYVEWFDGYSGDHGFSNHDLISNTIGSGVSYLRTVYPSFASKVDLRVEYIPSEGMQGFHPMTDYSGYKYLVALKGAGFQLLKETPLKYIELHAGYYTRGFKKDDAPYFDERIATGYIGIGLNFSELFFSQKPTHWAGKSLDTFVDYYQIPNTYYENRVSERIGPRR